MSIFNFKSQICTTREQSERLLALGLKKETADCRHFYDNRDDYAFFHHWVCSPYKWHKDSLVDNENIPAWSLHRLLSLYELHHIEFMNEEEIESMYDIVIDAIEQAIKEGNFPKEYLV